MRRCLREFRCFRCPTKSPHDVIMLVALSWSQLFVFQSRSKTQPQHTFTLTYRYGVEMETLWVVEPRRSQPALDCGLYRFFGETDLASIFCEGPPTMRNMSRTFIEEIESVNADHRLVRQTSGSSFLLTPSVQTPEWHP